MGRLVQAPSVKVFNQFGDGDQDAIPPRPPFPISDGRFLLKGHGSHAFHLRVAPSKLRALLPVPVCERLPPPLLMRASMSDSLEAWETFEMRNVEPDGYDRRGCITVVKSRQGQSVPGAYYQKSFFFLSFVHGTECALRWRARGFLAAVESCPWPEALSPSFRFIKPPILMKWLNAIVLVCVLSKRKGIA